MIDGFLHRIEWTNPYVKPPENAPMVLAEIFTLSSKTPTQLKSIPYSIGGGYGISIRHVSPPGRQMSQGALASIRKKRLKRRIESKVPLFADYFIADEIAKKPEYYDGITDERLRLQRESMLAEELIRYQFLVENIDVLFVYGCQPAACEEKAKRLQAEMAACCLKSSSAGK